MNNERRYNDGRVVIEYKETDAPETTFAPHCHEKLELYCLLEGAVDFRVEGVVYPMNPGDILLLDHSRFHSVLALAGEENYRRVVLQFSPELFYPEEQLLLNLFRGANILYPNGWNQGIAEVFSRLDRAIQLKPPIKDIAIRTKIVDILVRLFAMSENARGASLDSTQLKEVIDYINAHLTEPLTQEGLAERFYMSRNTLARGFSRVTGSTIKDYILYKRMALARIFLRAGHPAAVVARECGFGDYTTFYRGYRKIYGQSPSDPIHVKDAPAPTVLAAAPEDL